MIKTKTLVVNHPIMCVCSATLAVYKHEPVPYIGVFVSLLVIMIHNTACIILVLLFKYTVYCMLCVYISNSLHTFVAGFDEHSEGGM